MNANASQRPPFSRFPAQSRKITCIVCKGSPRLMPRAPLLYKVIGFGYLSMEPEMTIFMTSEVPS